MENNKLIAEFMGLCPLSRSGFISDKKQEYYGSLSDLQYHTSWNWLMPVVEKIGHCIEKPFDLGNLKYAFLNDNIEVVYDEVVELIKQLNKK